MLCWQSLTQSISGRRARRESGAWIKWLQELLAGGTLAAERFPGAQGFQTECPYNPSRRLEPFGRLTHERRAGLKVQIGCDRSTCWKGAVRLNQRAAKAEVQRCPVKPAIDKRLARTLLLLARYGKDDQPPRSKSASGYIGVPLRLHGAKSLTGRKLRLKYSFRRALEKIHDG
jgi:hypothetical protein